MQEEKRVIVPPHAYDIISEILKKFSLEEKEREMFDKIYNSRKTVRDVYSLYEEFPSSVLARMTRLLKKGNISDEEVLSIFVEKLGLDNEKAVAMLEEVKRRLVAFSEIVDKGEKTEKPEEVKETILHKEEKEQEESVDIEREETKETDPYREPLE